MEYTNYIFPVDYFIKDDLPFYTWRSGNHRFRIHYIINDQEQLNATIFSYDTVSKKWFEVSNNENKRDMMLISLLFTNVNTGVNSSYKSSINKKMQFKKHLSAERIKKLDDLYSAILIRS